MAFTSLKPTAMKRILTFIAATIVATIASAQEGKHALEITTGYPSIISGFEFPNDFRYSHEGRSVNGHFQYGFNIGYTYSFSKRWEVNPMLHLHRTSYEILQYPETDSPLMDSGKDFDWDAEPTLVEENQSISGSINVSFRYKWLVRECFCMYSALGLGFTKDLCLGMGSIELPCPIPYFAPVGIKFGKGRIYGIVEVNLSAANTLGMAGVGIKL